MEGDDTLRFVDLPFFIYYIILSGQLRDHQIAHFVNAFEGRLHTRRYSISAQVRQFSPSRDTFWQTSHVHVSTQSRGQSCILRYTADTACVARTLMRDE